MSDDSPRRGKAQSNWMISVSVATPCFLGILLALEEADGVAVIEEFRQNVVGDLRAGRIRSPHHLEADGVEMGIADQVALPGQTSTEVDLLLEPFDQTAIDQRLSQGFVESDVVCLGDGHQCIERG